MIWCNLRFFFIFGKRHWCFLKSLFYFSENSNFHWTLPNELLLCDLKFLVWETLFLSPQPHEALIPLHLASPLQLPGVGLKVSGRKSPLTSTAAPGPVGELGATQGTHVNNQLNISTSCGAALTQLECRTASRPVLTVLLAWSLETRATQNWFQQLPDCQVSAPESTVAWKCHMFNLRHCTNQP